MHPWPQKCALDRYMNLLVNKVSLALVDCYAAPFKPIYS